MTLEERVQKDMIKAMKAKDKNALSGLRAIKSAILLAKTDGSGREIDDKLEIAILQKLIKQRQESLDIYEEQNREDLAQIERDEIKVIEVYLPEQLSEEQVTEIVMRIIDEVGATSMKDMGKVMGKANAEIQGQVDGKTLAGIVKSKLLS